MLARALVAHAPLTRSAKQFVWTHILPGWNMLDRVPACLALQPGTPTLLASLHLCEPARRLKQPPKERKHEEKHGN